MIYGDILKVENEFVRERGTHVKSDNSNVTSLIGSHIRTSDWYKDQ